MGTKQTTILILGTFDTKAEEHAFLRQRILDLGCQVMMMDVGIRDCDCGFPIDVPGSVSADAAGTDMDSIRERNDRGYAMECLSRGAATVVRRLLDDRGFSGVIGMGGSGGSSVITAAMRALPIGIPKVCVSTMAGSSDASLYVGCKDILMMPSITDVAGVNRISRHVFSQAAAAVCGMAKVAPQASQQDRPIIVASMFGNTTECVTSCRNQLDDAGYEVLTFHAVGSGGRTMETLIDEGMVQGCLDITTTEWADQICGGIFAAGEDRLSAAGRAGIPHLIAPGCIDMVNFGPMSSVPAKYRDAGRLFYEWNPTVTLMRTNVAENVRLGEIFAAKANDASGPITILLPLRGVSVLDGDGERFCDREADLAMFDSLKQNLRSDIPVVEVGANINDAEFAEQAVSTMLNMMAEQHGAS